jgi:hypothetical protein
MLRVAYVALCLVGFSCPTYRGLSVFLTVYRKGKENRSVYAL